MPNTDASVHPSRRDFVRTAGRGALLPLLPGLVLPSRTPVETHDGVGFAEGGHVPRSAAWPEDPRHDPMRVSRVVGASHSDLDTVRALVEEQPALAKASWDWGFGDWETPLGAASHVGRRDIAELLLTHGARPTVFSAAMMGQLEVVRAFLEADPGTFTTHGPHGISLVRHAMAGGDDAAHVVDYLLDRFGPDPVPFGFRPDADVATRCSGRYRSDAAEAFALVVGVRNDMLMMGTGETPSSRVLPVDGTTDTFHPTGAPSVRLRFLGVDGPAEALEVVDGPFTWRGERVAGS